jgi:hypothetical protein
MIHLDGNPAEDVAAIEKVPSARRPKATPEKASKPVPKKTKEKAELLC